MNSPVLELQNVSFTGKSDRSMALLDTTLTLSRGDLLMLHLDRSQASRDLASMIQGLQKPKQGKVLFEGSDWLGNDFDRHFRMRNRIGRVFDDQAWLANLNMNENLMLASHHHGGHPRKSWKKPAFYLKCSRSILHHASDRHSWTRCGYNSFSGCER